MDRVFVSRPSDGGARYGVDFTIALQECKGKNDLYCQRPFGVGFSTAIGKLKTFGACHHLAETVDIAQMHLNYRKNTARNSPLPRMQYLVVQ